MAKKTAETKRRAKVKNLPPQAEQSLTAKEAKKVKGGSLSSSYPGGITVALGDGSVRFVNPAVGKK